MDDNEGFRKPLCQTLERAGYEVLSAADGAAALRLFRQQPVDLVITDIIMPEKEGLETIMELRRIKPELKIIAISGGGRIGAEDYLPLAEHLGAARTLAKPFSSAEIIEAVSGLLGAPGTSKPGKRGTAGPGP